jgi:DNA-binding transcriptional ArsR family regulator
MKNLSNEILEMVAEQFRVLAEPVRLQILQCVGNEERAVGEIVELSGASQPNVSKHLKIMQRAGILIRRQDKNNAYFRVADPNIFEMCEMVCGSIKAASDERLKAIAVI